MDISSYKTLPIWTSNYSIGLSVLSLEEPLSKEEYKENYPQSIIQICKDNGLRDLFLVENNFAGFVKGLKNCRQNDINFNFGLKIVVCEDINIKSNESLETEHKVIIFARNDNGYKRLIDIYSTASIKGFYYRPRIDYKTIQEFWSDEDLLLIHPFYYSFLHRNFLYGSKCSFIEFTNSFFLLEQNDLPFNYLINSAIENYSKDHKINTISAKSIYYKDKSYFQSYLVSRAIQKRTTLDKPNLDHLSDDTFSFEAWQKLNFQN
jgi:DNA polymerase-3 subunit alpha